MPEKEIELLVEKNKPRYERFFRLLGSQLEEAYLVGGTKAISQAIKRSKATLQNLLSKNHAQAIAVGIKTTTVVSARKARFRPRKPVLVDPRESLEHSEIVASLFLKNFADHTEDISSTSADLSKRAVAAGIDAGMSPKQIARLVRNSVGGDVAPWRADMIARTETASAYNFASLETAKELQDNVGVLMKTWVAATDERVRETHAAIDGKTIPMDEDFTVGESQLSFPGDPTGDPSEVINCRCTLVYELSGD